MDPQHTSPHSGGTLLAQAVDARLARRSFLKYSGMAAATAALVTVVGCKDDDPDVAGINLGSGDTGILNYAYALEQLEAAFYIQVMSTPFSGMTARETEYLTDIRDHEIAHREFFKNALGSNAIPGLEVNFTSINFGNRDSVLGTAKAFEDLGVSAYNGAGKLLTNPTNLGMAGKIVSVEARHAAIIRDLISPASGTAFANSEVVDDMNGLDVVRTPLQVLESAKAFLRSTLNASNLPTS